LNTDQRENLDAIVRWSVLPAGADADDQRPLPRELTSARPLPADVTMTVATLGRLRTAETAGAVTLSACDVVDRPVVAP
jgi:hypothetical protein